MINNLRLSICIPTYNRAPYLKESLGVLLPQIQPYKDELEILISDNCSDDNTQEIVEQASKDYKVEIVYSKNDKNIGGNNNMAKVVAQSKGDYVYIMGDDDYLSPDFMTILFRLLHKGKNYSLIYFNRLSGDDKCSHCQISDNQFEKMERQLKPEVFVSEILNNANFISAIVFNRQCWDLGKLHLKDDEYFGYSWFARIYWGSVEYGKDCIYYYMPLVIQRNGPKTWMKFWPQYLISSMSNIFYDLDSVVNGVYGKWKKRLKPDVLNALPYITYNRSYYRKKEIKRMLFKHMTSWEKTIYYFYLIPGTFFFYRVKSKLQRLAF